MAVKTIFGAVLAVAVGGMALGFASKYRGACCSNEAKQGFSVTASTSKEGMVSHEGECLGGCATSGDSGGKECCQTAALSINVSQSGKGHEAACQGDCAHGESSGGQKCCQDAEKPIDSVASPN